jgi:hypothetical protein
MNTDNNNYYLGLPSERNLNGLSIASGTSQLGKIIIEITTIEEDKTSFSNTHNINPIDQFKINGKIININSINRFVNHLDVIAYDKAALNKPIGKAIVNEKGEFEIILDISDFENDIKVIQEQLHFVVRHNTNEIPIFLRPLYQNNSSNSIDLYIELDYSNYNSKVDDNTTFIGTVNTSNELSILHTELIVRFYKAGINQEEFIGSTHIEPNFSFTKTLHLPENNNVLFCKVFDIYEKLVFVSEYNSFVGNYQVGKSENLINLVSFTLNTVSDYSFKKSEYDRFTFIINRIFGEINSIESKESNLLFVSQKTGVSTEYLSFLILATGNFATDPIEPELLYGLFRLGMPTNISEITLSDVDSVANRLGEAVIRGIVNEDSVTQIAIDEIIEILKNNWGSKLVDYDFWQTGLSINSILSEVVNLSEAQIQAFSIGYWNNRGDLVNFWTQLSNFIPGISNTEANAIRFAFQSSGLAFGSYEIFSSFISAYSNSLNGGLVALCSWSQSDIETFLLSAVSSNGGRDIFPSIVPGNNVTQKSQNMALAISRIIEHCYPTQTISAKLDEASHPISDNLNTFLSNNPNFEFGKQSVVQYINGNPSALNGITGNTNDFVQSISDLQNRYRLAPGLDQYKTISILEQLNINSPLALTNKSWNDFESEFVALGGSADIAAASYELAHRSSASTQIFYQKYSTDLKVPIKVLDSVDLNQFIQDEFGSDPDLKTLFGNQDYCSCKHCRSIYSPAAYLADVFQFLNKIKADRNNSLNITVWDLLEERRPDLCQILLNCENANTSLPYIDIVNEVLENAVLVSIGEEPNYSELQTTRLANELKILPEHIQLSVYNNEVDGNEPMPLSGSIYPWKLPFDFWTTSSRAYLAHIKMTRVELIEKFTKLESDLNNVQNAWVNEIIQITPIEFQALTDVTFDKKIWGLPDNSTNLVSLLSNVNNLLLRSGIDFSELQAIINTRYINPTGELLILFDASDACNVDLAKLAYKNSANVVTYLSETGANHGLPDKDIFSRIARFWRVKYRLNISVSDTDALFRVVGVSNNSHLSSDHLYKIAVIKTCQTKFKKPFVELTSFFGNIDTGHINDKVTSRSQYDKLFKNKTIAEIANGIFDLNSSKSELQTSNNLLSNHLGEIRQALGISIQDLNALIDYLFGDSTPPIYLSLTVLSNLWRHVYLSKLLKVSINDLIIAFKLTGWDPFTYEKAEDFNNLPKIIAFADWIKDCKELKLSFSQLRFWQNERYYVNDGFSLTTEEASKTLLEIKDQLIKIDSDNTFFEDPSGILLRNSLSLKYTITEVKDIFECIAEETSNNIIFQKIVNEILIPNNVIDSPVNDWDTLDENLDWVDLTDKEQRINFIYQILLTEQNNNQKRSYLLQFMVDYFKVLPESGQFILSLTLNEEENSLTLMDLFLKIETDLPSPIDLVNTYPGAISKAFHKAFKLSSIFNGLKLNNEDFKALLKFGFSNSWNGWVNPDNIYGSFDRDWTNYDYSSYESLCFKLVHAAKFFKWSKRFSNSQKPIFNILQNIDLTDNNFASLGYLTFLNDLSQTTGWEKHTLEILVNQYIDSSPDSAFEKLFEAELYLKLNLQFDFLFKSGASIHQIIDTEETSNDWVSLVVNEFGAISLMQSIRSVNTDESWKIVGKEIRDILREQQRDALIAYLCYYPSQEFKSSLDLYNQYLIDPEMGACTMTSRIRLAISSAQLFIQRCLMNLEPQVVLNSSDAELWDQWEWMKRYRVWEANRKVFTYPENWIEPELRDNKSEFFKELEEELNQGEVNDELVNSAYLNYLKKLEAVSNMDILGICRAEEINDIYSDSYYFFGKSKGKPTNLYYRKWNIDRTWSSWQKIETDFEGDHLIPIVFNQKLYLFWPRIDFIKANNPDPGLTEDMKRIAMRASISLCWSSLSNNSWSSSRMFGALEESDNWIYTNNFETGPIAFQRFYFVKMQIPDDPTVIKIAALRREGTGISVSNYREIGHFKFNVSENCSIVYGGNESNETYIDAMVGRLTKFQYRSFQVVDNYVNPSNGLWICGHQILNNVEYDTNSKVLFIDDQYSTNANGYLYGEYNIFLKPFVFNDAQKTYVISRKGQKFLFSNFYHSHVSEFTRAVNMGGVELLLNGPANHSDGRIRSLRRQNVPVIPLFFQNRYQPVTENVDSNFPIEDIHFNYSEAYGEYNWELFFHIPMLIAGKLAQNQKFNDAIKWYKFIFDPTDTSDLPSPQRYWKIRPFFEYFSENNNQPNSINELMELLSGNNSTFSAEVDNWRENPFNPHLIARGRMMAYMKNVVMKFIDTLIQWADMLFRQDTIETNNEAAQLYLLAYSILGDRPKKVEGKEAEDKTYCQLKDSLDEFSNALVKLEERISASLYQQSSNTSVFNRNQILFADIEFLSQSSSSTFYFSNGLGQKTESSALPINDLTFKDKSLVITEHELGRSFPNGHWIENEFRAFKPEFYRQKHVSNVIKGLYFCIPANDKLLSYWELVADRLFKLRHCMDIEGRFRQLPLYEPPIDPALLVRATAAGLDLSSVITDLNAPLPHYRFNYILAKSKEFCNITKSLGQNILSALEKRDAEDLSNLRTYNEISMLEEITKIKSSQIEEGKSNLNALKKNKEISSAKVDYYSSLEDEVLNSLEVQQILLQNDSNRLMVTSQTVRGVSAFLSQIPEVSVKASPTAAGLISSIVNGVAIATGTSFTSDAMSIGASILSNKATISGIIAGYQRRYQDWQFQLKLATLETSMLEQQILSSELRLQISENELENHRLSIEQKQAELDFMKSKFTNKDLYNWMINQLSVAYFQSYQLAYQMAQQAERCYRYEMPDADNSFVSFGYWDSLKKGLLSSEKLEHDLLRMEVSYMEKNQRQFEITKTFSLGLWNPREILSLRATGRCEFDLIEEMFDLDHPGHYLRRIKAVSISIPCVAGPYTGVQGKLTLLNNEIRKSADISVGYSKVIEQGEEPDSRFIIDLARSQSIATSSGQNDSGLFNLNFNDERYLPFEGAGVISKWQFELPEGFRQFDYNTISDLILTIQYTAKDGGETFKENAIINLGIFVNPPEVVTPPEEDYSEPPFVLSRLFSLKHEFGNDFYLFNNPSNTSNRTTEFILNQNHFPFYLKDKNISVNTISVFVKPKNDLNSLNNWKCGVAYSTKVLVGQEFLNLTDTGFDDLEFIQLNDDNYKLVAAPNEFGGLQLKVFSGFSPTLSISTEDSNCSIFLNRSAEDWNSEVEDIFLLVEYSAV